MRLFLLRENPLLHISGHFLLTNILPGEKQGNITSDQPGGDPLSVVFEHFLIAQIGADDSMQLNWNSSDKLSVTDLQSTSVFALRSGSGSAKGKFNGTLEVKGSAVYAAYGAAFRLCHCGRQIYDKKMGHPSGGIFQTV